MAWIATIGSNRRDDRGRPIKCYRVGWHEIARDADGQPVPRDPNRPDSPPKLVRRQETFDTREAAQNRVDEINPKIARGQSAAALRDAGNRPLSTTRKPGWMAWPVRSTPGCWRTTGPTTGRKTSW